jgi:hypothetical protein
MRNAPLLLVLVSFAVAVATMWGLESQPANAAQSKAVPVFNGKDLTGWRVHDGKKEAWKVEDGVLVGTGGGGWLMTEKEYGDFAVFLQYRVGKKANTGVALRAPLKGDPAFNGLELQLLDDAGYPNLKPEQSTGAIWGLSAPSKKAAKRAGEWNDLMVGAKGGAIFVRMNGEEVNAPIVNRVVGGTIRADAKFKDMVKKHPGLLRRKGHIGLQNQTGRVEFRKIGVREL